MARTVCQAVKFLCDPVVRRAVQLRAVLDGTEQQRVIEAALRAYLPDQVDEVVRRGLVVEQPAGAKKPGMRRKEG